MIISLRLAAVFLGACLVDILLCSPVPSSIGNGGGSGAGSVTTVSVATANGFSGTVANPTTTPAITVVPSGPGVTNPSVCPDTSNSATTLVCSTSPSFTAATNNSIVLVVGTSPNSGTATVNVNGGGNKTIKKNGGGTNLAANDMLAGQRVQLVYDGTNWQMLSAVANAGAGAQDLFSSIPVAGQTTVTANSPTTALTFKNGANMTITTNNATKEITFACAGCGGGGGGSISSGTFAALPAPGTAGALYLPTDSIFSAIFDDGAAWNYLINGVVAVPVLAADFPTWVNQSSAAITDETSGSVKLDSVTGSGGTDIKLRVRTIPVAPYTAELCFSGWVRNQNFAGVGFGIRDSGSGKLQTFSLLFASGSVTGTALDNWNNPTSFNSNVGTDFWVTPASAVNCIRQADDGVNRTWSISSGGSNYFTVAQVATNNFLTPDQIGFFVNPNNSSTAPKVFIHSYRVF